MNCIVVDDDEFSRTVVKQFIERTPNLTLIAECEDAIEVFGILQRNQVDIAFLDVEMPEMSGIDLVKALKNLPQVVLITSRAEYAVEAFEYNVTDYLVKPVKYVRFLKAVEKAENNIRSGQILPEDSVEDKNYVFIKSDSKIVRLHLDEIHFVEALSDYVVLNTQGKKHIMHGTMKSMVQKLGEQFIRVHRSFIVNKNKIETIEDTKVVMPTKIIPIGASYKSKFLERLNFLA